MKTIRHLLLASGILSACSLAHGTVIVVSPGQNVQTVIDVASNGDLIRVMQGSYGNLSIVNKNLTIRKHSPTPPSFANIEVNGSVVTLIGIEATNLKARDTASPTKLKVVQGHYSNYIDFNASKGDFLYCGMHRMTFRGVGNVVGCALNGNSQGGIGLVIYGDNTSLTVRNSRIHDYKDSLTGTIDEECIGIHVDLGANADIINNLIEGCSDTDAGGGETSNTAKAILVKPGAGKVNILGNLIRDCVISNTNTQMLKAPLGTIFRNNMIVERASGHIFKARGFTGGVIGVDVELDVIDPKLNSDFTLASDSPAINAGPPDPQYNDRDGTRNDIGMYGGHNYIPNGRTTKKPIVIDLQVTPITVPAGGIITIQSTGAAPK